MRAPRVSVVMTAYNHAAYVGKSIESVLAQSFPDYEFLITDDGSRDDSPRIIDRYHDPRIRFLPNSRNRGFAAAINRLIEEARGEYVAVLNSDDFWPDDKLAFQIQFLDEHAEYGVMFGNAVFIDERDMPLPVERMPHRFDQPNRSPGAWLRQFFTNGNCICHPTVLIRRSCFDEVGLYDNRYRQLPDFDMWIRLAKRYRFFVSRRPLVFYRWGTGDNASAITPETQVRTAAEHALLAEDFFAAVDPVTLREGFGDLLTYADIRSEAHLEIEKALIYFRVRSYSSSLYHSIGLRKLANFLINEPHRSVLISDYGFGDLAFQRLAGLVDFFARSGGVPAPSLDAALPARMVVGA